MREESLLDVRALKVIYQTDEETVYAVNGISFSLNKGSSIGLVGETGAGKTTTALSILRLLPARTGRIASGEILFSGRDLTKSSAAEMRAVRGAKIAMIFQDPMTSLNPVFTVEEQIAESLRLHNAAGRSEKEIGARVDEVLELVGIPVSRKTEYPHQFSGGMRQRIVIAIALVCEPDLLIADEPTTALDVTIQAQVLMMIRELRDRLRTSMILISHDLGVIAQTCDHVAVMYAGELVEVGTSEDIFNGSVHHAYVTGLFGSIPNLRKKTARLNPIPGLMPDPSHLPPGCRFAPRCPSRAPLCDTTHPGMYARGTHKIACRLLAGTAGWQAENERNHGG
jgi:peptide/nickel transport system ATP-binding protein